MSIFVEENLEPALIIQVRNSDSSYGEAIRATLGSWGNHTAMLIKHNTRGWVIGEAIPPKSQYTRLSVYEAMMNQDCRIRVWRLNDLTPDDRLNISMFWQQYCDGVSYPSKFSMARLAVFRFVNNLPWKLRMRGKFCSDLVHEAIIGGLSREILPKPDGNIKKNWTPRTFENRYVAGLLTDVTDRVLNS